MLHPVPDSRHRARLLRIVVLQRRLIQALCALPEGSAVTLDWLRRVWDELDPDWVRRFWENDRDPATRQGRRSNWINHIATAAEADKNTILEISAEQLRFHEIYDGNPPPRLRQVNWQEAVFSDVNKLLKSFYAPLLYETETWEGYPAPCAADGQFLHKDTFIAGFPGGGPRVCPYCDNYLQVTELDHFLPKDSFPFLSCHPDNLFPSCHDSNRGCNKGTTPPLTPEAEDQANDWFHPKWRTAQGRYLVAFREDDNHQLKLRLDPATPEDTTRVVNLDELFDLSGFWGRTVNPDIQQVTGVISVLLETEPRPISGETVRRKLLQQAAIFTRMTGTWGLAIPQSFLYTFMAGNQALIQDILRECSTNAGPS